MLTNENINEVIKQTPEIAWKFIFKNLWDEFSKPFESESIENEVIKRDNLTSAIEFLISGSAWNMWDYYEKGVYRTCNALIDFWNEQKGGKAILILDGLSLRESPILLEELKQRGYTVKKSIATGAELPADTNSFATSLGFSQRSSLENNGAGKTHKLFGATTESVNLPWKDCISLIGSEKDIILWHHWPDLKLHEFNKPGYGLPKFTQEIKKTLQSEDFWSFIKRLSNGRTLVITGDHGYASTGLFSDVQDESQKEYLKEVFKSQRFRKGNEKKYNWVPPIEKSIKSEHGMYSYVLGRRKWKSSGGYPTLAHGGLTLLEVSVPFIEITRKEG